jgi:hypothetical protein
MPEPTPIWDELEPRWRELHPDQTDTTPTSYDVGSDVLPPINPDCLAGKHHVCPGDAWDDDADEPTECVCECHVERPVVDVIEAL